MTPRIQYVTTPDGVRIAYATFGEGDGVPLVVLRPSQVSHVEAEWRLSRQLSWLGALLGAQLAGGRRVVRLDVRGGGLSDMFGGGQLGGSMAGSTVVERNLDRDTQVALIESYINSVGNETR